MMALPEPSVVRQMINDCEIGGECHNAAICRCFELTPIEAAMAIDEAHV